MIHKHGGDVYSHKVRLDYSTNLNFLGMPESVRKAACEGVGFSEHYPDVECRDLRRAVSLQEGVPESSLVFGNGAADLIYAAVLADKPKKAVLCAPTFHEYGQALRTVGCRTETVFLKEENAFRYTETILDALTDDTDMLIICNPNNPTGQPLPRKLLLKILSVCRERNIRFLLDECFVDFMDDPAAATAKPYLAEHPELFILKAFTKIYCMPGLRLGYGICSDALFLRRLTEYHQPWNVSIPAQRAGVAACGEQEYVRHFRSLLAEEKTWFPDALAQAGMKVYGSAANYVFFRAPGDRGEMAGRLLERGILIRDCSNFEGLAPGYYRAVIRSREENQEFIRILRGIRTEVRYG